MEEFEEPLTVRDIPSLNLCFGKFYLQYGRNIQITIFDHQNETMKPLREGKNYVGGHELFMKLLPPRRWGDNHCVTINTNYSEEFYSKYVANSNYLDKRFSLGIFGVEILNGKEENYLDVVYLYLTSEENSHSAPFQQWFAGNIDPLHLRKGQMHYVQIPKVSRYKYLEGTCTPQSAIGCLASKVIQSNECQENDKPCSPNWSLPSNQRFIDLPVCTSNKTLKECKKIFKEIWFHDCVSSKTTCTVQEYSAMELEWMRCGLSKEKCLKLVEDFFGIFKFKHRAMSQKYSHVKFHPEDPENMFVFKVVID